MRTVRLAVLVLAVAVLNLPTPPLDARGPRTSAPPSFTTFESGPVRPLALSPDGTTLFATNTPDNRLEVYRVTARGLRHRGSVPVGLEPVAVAARSADEAWVVNHLSDSVSVVELFPRHPGRARGPVGRVSRTLLVGDEPRDIVFAGPSRNRAFVTTAHRGQNVPYDPQLTTPGVGRADVWVFDADAQDATLGGTPLTILNLFTDTPRALAASPDGQLVYAAGFHTGNRSTTIFEEVVRANGGLPPPVVPIGGGATIPVNFEFKPQPPTSLIVQFNGANWVDEVGRVWDSKVKFTLPDKDVFVINAAANPPVVGPGMSISGVGTVLFNMAVNPATGRVYVSNTEAKNLTRFEGPGTFAGHTVRGHLAESRISVIDGLAATSRHLNKHVDFDAAPQPVPNPVSRRSLSMPTDLAVTQDGSTLYVAAFGSSKVGVFNTAALEGDTFVPDEASQIPVSGGGPGGLALDEARGRLYVLTRFDNSIAIVNTSTKAEIGKVSMHNPEPPSVVNGRRFLYDAAFTSGNGTVSCATCHVFGDFDSLAWDLGNPDDVLIPNPGPFRLHPSEVPSTVPVDFRPMKGPMATQSLRGMANHGSMHWRGDRTGGNDVPPGTSAQPDTGSFDEDAAFKKFNVAFPGLLGRDSQLNAADLQAFTDFVLQIVYPPNPVRKLDNSLTAMQQGGRDIYMGTRKTDTFFNCNGCHVLNPQANVEFGVARPGFFGTDGMWSFEGEPQVFKIPHLRNMYQKVGMFGMPKAPFFLPENLANPTADNVFTGDQVRGFGFFHDGSVDTLFRFHSTLLFAPRPPGTISPNDPGNLQGFPLSAQGFLEKKQMEQFMLAFDSNLAPIVGQQVTLSRDNAAAAQPRIDLMMSRADADECELVAHVLGEGFLYMGGGKFRSGRNAHVRVPFAVLRALSRVRHGEVTFTCVPPGSGPRISGDRDEGDSEDD